VDLNQYGAAEAAKEHFPAIVQNNTVDGRLIAMPWFTDAGLLYYRTDLLKKYDYTELPKTWDELETMAKKIQDGEVMAGNEKFWGFVWQGNSYEGLTCDALEWIASSDGGTFIDVNKNVTINNPNAIEALERAAKWVGSISPPAVTGFIEEDARRWWQAGNAAFMRNWPYVYSLADKDSSPVKGKFDVAPLPGEKPGTGVATLGGWQLAVSKYSAHPKEAADFVLFLTSKAEQKRRAIKASFSPTISSLYADPEVLKAAPFFGRLSNVFVNAVARPSAQTVPKYSQASTFIFTAVHNVLTRQKSAQVALEGLEIDLKELLESR
jgi:trehalose/maltose transport system substrate-binding protein